MKRTFYISFATVILSSFAGIALFIWHIENRLPNVIYSDFLASVEQGQVSEVHLRGGKVTFVDIHNKKMSTFTPDLTGLMPRLSVNKVKVSAEANSRLSWPLALISIPIGLVLVLLLVGRRRPRESRHDETECDFAKDKVACLAAGEREVTFRDVAGIPEAKEELQEIVDFLKDPQQFCRLGASSPKGILLQGSPGTGKTLLAKAIAGEAQVPFYSISGSDFVEMFVGVGASRVRDLFKEAKKNSPCIIFIDEIDAVGAHRGGGGGVGGQDERGQTLNALLVEMDGFSRNDTTIVLAATNRPDILDPALRRPGRFDRLITILPPDVKGRLKILEVHGALVQLAEDVDLAEIARNTPGFTGAELANLVNEAALIAAREGKDSIHEPDFHAAIERIMIGVERKGMVINKDERRTMAYHEAGHAILTRLLPNTDPIQKISIIPRGKAMGHTQQQQLTDRHSYTKEYLLNRITILLGGRVAENIALSQQTSGAEDDLLRATQIATKMVCQWGMDEELGPLAYQRADEGFLGGEVQMTCSEFMAKQIDKAVRRQVEECHELAQKTLQAHKGFLKHLAEIILQTETLDSEELEIIFDCSRKKQLQKEGEEPPPCVCTDCPASGHCVQPSSSDYY
ncbi:MAG: ATP-dependent zinc metalloprotease FtsH [Thermodesulfobacteriota bacterium]